MTATRKLSVWLRGSGCLELTLPEAEALAAVEKFRTKAYDMQMVLEAKGPDDVVYAAVRWHDIVGVATEPGAAPKHAHLPEGVSAHHKAHKGE